VLAIRTGASPRSFDDVKSAGRLMVCWEDARPFIVTGGRRWEQTPAFCGLSGRSEDNITHLRGVFGSGGLFSK
jgi:hypothetical protein